MTRLNNYRNAMLAADATLTDAELTGLLDGRGAAFVSFVVDHGLGPLWHERTRYDAFRQSRFSAEALYVAQEAAIAEIDAAFADSGIKYALIKGAASRLLLYTNPAIRACHDIDLLVRPDDRVRAAQSLVRSGFSARPEPRGISREILLSRDSVHIDLHWGILREGRLREDCTEDFINRRQQRDQTWMLDTEDALFVLLIHPAFAKHLAGWSMGLHRVLDVLRYLESQEFDWDKVCWSCERCGVSTAAWATLRWVQLVCVNKEPDELSTMITDVAPGRLRRKWLEQWLQRDLSSRLARWRWARLLAFSALLHDTSGDAMRAVVGRSRAHRRRFADMDAFSEISGSDAAPS